MRSAYSYNGTDNMGYYAYNGATNKMNNLPFVVPIFTYLEAPNIGGSGDTGSGLSPRFYFRGIVKHACRGLGALSAGVIGNDAATGQKYLSVGGAGYQGFRIA